MRIVFDLLGNLIGNLGFAQDVRFGDGWCGSVDRLESHFARLVCSFVVFEYGVVVCGGGCVALFESDVRGQDNDSGGRLLAVCRKASARLLAVF